MTSALHADRAWKSMIRSVPEGAGHPPTTRHAGAAAYAALLRSSDGPAGSTAARSWLLLRARTADRLRGH
ncbi:hypothetical protein SAMN02745830_01029 [Streptomyces sp. Amel2xC10]|nr:hypothetical protein SAMN02745830_01029 [Streptomyces sp. Amel2xC10]